MQHSELYQMLQDLYPGDTNRRPQMLAVGWAADAAAITQLAAIDFNLTYASTVREALISLRDGGVCDAVVVNSQAGFDAYVATAALRLYTTSPIVLLYPRDYPVVPSDAVDAGADDWLPEVTHPSEFAARVYARIRRHQFNQRQVRVMAPPWRGANTNLKQLRPFS
ncbi:MAG: hypothetical protein R2873_09365 [Caldilineaceae bacterium]|nr:hypothetical protein [Caldilineaceae bacterium]